MQDAIAAQRPTGEDVYASLRPRLLLLGIDHRHVGGVVAAAIAAQAVAGVGAVTALGALPVLWWLRQRMDQRRTVAAVRSTPWHVLVLEDPNGALAQKLQEGLKGRPLLVETPLTTGHLLQRYALKQLCNRHGIHVLFCDGENVTMRWLCGENHQRTGISRQTDP